MFKIAKETKTNVMRLLEQAGLSYQVLINQQPVDPANGDSVSGQRKNSNQIFKTLVTQGKSGENYVFMIPISETLDLKKAASAVGEKSIAMIKEKELLPLTGYIHGGCSPIGMKKTFVTSIDEVASLYETIAFSAGKVNYSVEMPLSSLKKMIPDIQVVDLISLS